MDRIAEKIIKQIDSGMDIMDIAKFFGGIDSMLEQVKKYPYLQALVMTKLGGEIYGSLPDEDEVMIPFEIPFVIVAIDEDDMDDFLHYNVEVNFLIPELKLKSELIIIYNWLSEYLMDLGSEVGSFNDSKFNHTPTWIHASRLMVSMSENLRLITKSQIKSSLKLYQNIISEINMDFKVNSRQELLIFNRITSYLEDMFDLDDMTLEYDAHGDSVAISSKEEWDNYFKVYFHDYWNPYNVEGQKMAKDSPILQVENKYEEELDSLFGNKWEEPMKQFIENNFEFKIKTILKKHDRF